MGIILKENNLVHTKIQHSKFLGSSKYDYDKVNNRLVLKVRKKKNIVQSSELYEVTESDLYFEKCRIDYGISSSDILLGRKQLLKKAELNNTVSKDKNKRVYVLNKKKVREKCSAFFGLKSSRKFLAFYSISFPLNFEDDLCMKVFNTFLTRLRKDFRLRSYLWVAERQKNGTLHFHLLTNSFMPIRKVNYYMSKAINNQVKNSNEVSNFDMLSYNGVDVKRVNNNRKALNCYLTKYISKNNIFFYRLPYHSSRDISELFTAETFTSIKDPDYKSILSVLMHINTFVIDNEYCSVEYLNVVQDNGKYFNPPDSWYWLRDHINELIYKNHYSKYKLNVLPIT